MKSWGIVFGAPGLIQPNGTIVTGHSEPAKVASKTAWAADSVG